MDLIELHDICKTYYLGEVAVPVSPNGIMLFCIESGNDSAIYGYINVSGETVFRHTETGKENVKKLALFCH